MTMKNHVIKKSDSWYIVYVRSWKFSWRLRVKLNLKERKKPRYDGFRGICGSIVGFETQSVWGETRVTTGATRFRRFESPITTGATRLDWFDSPMISVDAPLITMYHDPLNHSRFSYSPKSILMCHLRRLLWLQVKFEVFDLFFIVFSPSWEMIAYSLASFSDPSEMISKAIGTPLEFTETKKKERQRQNKCEM